MQHLIVARGAHRRGAAERPAQHIGSEIERIPKRKGRYGRVVWVRVQAWYAQLPLSDPVPHHAWQPQEVPALRTSAYVGTRMDSPSGKLPAVQGSTVEG